MQGEIFAQVGLNQVVKHEGGKATASPGWMHCQVGEVGFTPPEEENSSKICETEAITQTCNQGPLVQNQHRAFYKVQHKRSLERATLPQGQCQARTSEKSDSRCSLKHCTMRADQTEVSTFSARQLTAGTS